MATLLQIKDFMEINWTSVFNGFGRYIHTNMCMLHCKSIWIWYWCFVYLNIMIIQGLEYHQLVWSFLCINITNLNIHIYPFLFSYYLLLHISRDMFFLWTKICDFFFILCIILRKWTYKSKNFTFNTS